VAEIVEEEISFTADGNLLHGASFAPASIPSRGTSAVLVLHGFPSPAVGAVQAATAYVSMARRIAEAVGCIAMSFSFRGCGASQGSFSVEGWRSDTEAAIALLSEREDVNTVLVVGFGTGAALAISAAAGIADVAAVAALGPPADFSDWAADPEQLLAHCRQLGLIVDESFPADFDAWAAEIRTSGAADHAGRVSPRPLLVVHGAEDEIVPVFDARVIADAHGSAELRVLAGAGHGLRFDPRAVAVLLGWLDRYT